MNFDRSSQILAGAKRALAVLAIVAGFSLAAPTAFADISYIATDLTNGGTKDNGVAPGNGNNLSTSVQVGHFGVSIQSFRTDPNPSTLSTTTIDINNTGTNTSTLQIFVSSKDFTTSLSPLTLTATIQGTSSNALAGQTASGQTWIDTSNTLFGTPGAGTSGSLAGTANNTGATIYTFANGGVFGPVSVAGAAPFAITQEITLTLAAGRQGQITISSNVVGVPEPSTMAIAGLGALGMIGYGIRRRKGA